MRSLSLSLFFLFLSMDLWSEAPLPKINKPVNDYAKVFSINEKQGLESSIRKLYQSLNIKVAIVTIESLGGESIEGLSIKIVEKEKLGNRDIDNGILMLLAMKERKVRIEVGRGLEGTVTDFDSHKIIKNSLVPHFKRNDFFSGFQQGLSDIAALHGQNGLIQTSKKFTPVKRRSYEKRGGNKMGHLIFFGFILISFLSSLFKAPLLRGFFSAIIVTILAYVMFGMAFGVLLFVVAPIFGFIFGLMGINRGIYYGSSGGSWRSGRGGFGGGGGSWGGGGGGFSGGGASGDW